MKYREEMNYTDSYKKEYIDGLENLIKEREECAEKTRKEYIKNIFETPVKYREDLKNMLGWPLVGYEAEGIPDTTFEKLSVEDGYTIYRVKFEVLKGVKLSGLYFEADGAEEKPLVILQHGGSGTPERISNVFGDTTNYNDMLHRVRCHGVHVFAPQLLLWNKEDYKVDYDRISVDSRLKRCGSSITAVEVFAITRVIDYFESEKNIKTFGMAGLSYGGFYTLYTAAVDERISSALSCSFFARREPVDWADWTWFDSLNKFNDAEIACLVYPRKLYLAMGNKDELFDSRASEESYKNILDLSSSVGADWVNLKIFEGTHEFIKDDEQIEKLIKDLKG